MGSGLSEFSDEDALLLGNINTTMAVFSLIGSTFSILCFIKFKELRSFAFKLILFLAISDWWNAIGNVLGDAGGEGDDPHDDRPKCQFQAILISYFELTSVLWSAAIAFTLHRAFLLEDPNYSGTTIETRARLYHAVIWGGSFILTLLPLTTNSYGDTGAWCWIKSSSSSDVAWRFIQFYIPLWFCIVYSAYVYIGVVRKMRALVQLAAVEGHAASEKSHNVWSMKFYPLVMIICFFWATCNRLYQTFGGGLVLWLNGLHVFFAASQGFGNVIVYVQTAQVAQRLRVSLYGTACCPCIKLAPEDQQPHDGTATVHGPGATTGAVGAHIDPDLEAHPSATASPATGYRDFDAKAAPGGVIGSSAEAAGGASAQAFGFSSVDDAQADASREHDAPLPEPIVPSNGAINDYGADGDQAATPSSKRPAGTVSEDGS